MTDFHRLYQRRGWSTFPIRGKAEPLVRWGEFQRRRPTVAEWDGWRTRWPDANVALVCGTVSRLVVLDVDPRNGGVQSLRGYPVLKPTVVTGGGGWHLHMTCEEPLATRNDLLPGVDFKAEGSYVVAPPSIHPSGRPYRWVGSVLPEVPAWLRELVAAAQPRRSLQPSQAFDFDPPFGVAPTLSVASRGEPTSAVREELAAVLPRLRHVTQTAEGYAACCPAHDDHTPSLSIRVTERGLLWHCFAGCAYKSIQLALTDPDHVDPAVWDRLAATRRGRPT